MIKKNKVKLELDQEHVRLAKDGDVAGLYNFKAEEVGGVDLWQKISRVIELYKKLHPREIEIHCMEVKAVTASRMNDKASTKDKSFRWGCSIPVGLMIKLEQVDRELFSNKPKFHNFLRRYPQFRVCKYV